MGKPLWRNSQGYSVRELHTAMQRGEVHGVRFNGPLVRVMRVSVRSGEVWGKVLATGNWEKFYGVRVTYGALA